MNPVVTIDGPSGAGKGTAARIVAQTLGFKLLDSGSLYRLTGLASLNQKMDLQSENGTADIARRLDVQFSIEDDVLKILLAGEDVTQKIRQEKIGMAASAVAAHTLVREALLQRQREFSTEMGLVADGRDMGTQVFSSAQCKIYLTATAEERAKRRVTQLESTGVTEISYDKILTDIELRDYQDSSRKVSPLKAADDAMVIDSTHFTIEGVCKKIIDKANSVFNPLACKGNI